MDPMLNLSVPLLFGDEQSLDWSDMIRSVTCLRERGWLCFLLLLPQTFSTQYLLGIIWGWLMDPCCSLSGADCPPQSETETETDRSSGSLTYDVKLHKCHKLVWQQVSSIKASSVAQSQKPIVKELLKPVHKCQSYHKKCTTVIFLTHSVVHFDTTTNKSTVNSKCHRDTPPVHQRNSFTPPT